MKRHVFQRLLLLVFVLAVASLPSCAQVTVVLVRHAEKAASPADDPPLTDAGKKRAELLASILADSGVEAIYVSELQRTQKTAAPLANRVHVTPTVIPANNTQQLVDAIRARKSGVVAVVGHSNKLPDIIAALGGPKIQIPETDYNNLFIVTVEPSQTSLLRLHYGDARPVAAQEGSMKDTMTAAPRK